MTMPVDVVVMAAGKGTRMKSRIPKVLQRLAGRPLVFHVLEQAGGLKARRVVLITGHDAMQVEAACVGVASAEGTFDLKFALQQPQLGTGHAVQQALPQLQDDGLVLVLSGDVPLTQRDTLQALLAASGGARLALLTVRLPDPAGYGRIVRAAGGQVQRIVEHKDASDAERAIDEIYSGIMAVPTRLLRRWVGQLRNDNAQQEYYFIDVVALAVAEGVPVVAHCIDDAVQVAGVNNPLQLAELERACQRRQADALMEQGVRLADPARFELRDDAARGTRGELLCAQDGEIDVGCIFTGRVELGEGVQVGAYCCIANAVIEAGAVIQPFTHIDGEKAGVQVGVGARVGPFSRLRPGAVLGRAVHVGNFVEIKNSQLADGAKANHLAYLGDASVGERVNYGAGSITANYDGVNKHRTVIEHDVHVGSNCVLVAPVTIGADGVVGAGSVVTEDAPPGVLTLGRGRQVSKTEWHRPAKPLKN